MTVKTESYAPQLFFKPQIFLFIYLFIYFFLVFTDIFLLFMNDIVTVQQLFASLKMYNQTNKTSPQFSLTQ